LKIIENMVKLICLGNEFIEEDSLAKKIGELLREDFDVVNIKDSFQLMEIISGDGDFVLLDVLEEADGVRRLRIEDLRVDSIMSAHDFDAGQVLKLLDVEVRIIGIPMKGDLKSIGKGVLKLVKAN